MTHAFAVCAYGQSPYLEACIRSLKGQSVPSLLMICTSTPSAFLDDIARRYGIPVYVRDGESSIGADWNFAYETAAGCAELVTLAHQDDIYMRDYTKTLLEMKRRYTDMSIFMTGSATAVEHRLAGPGLVGCVKRILRLPLSLPQLCDRASVKRAALMLGNPVICPSCTYVPEMCGHDIFDAGYRFVLDWDMLERMAGRPGRWICVEKPLIIYRVHRDAATGQCIRDHTREREESEMFDRLLPDPAAEIVKRLYRKSYDAYR